METFALEILPSALGMVLIIYVVAHIYRLRSEFFQVVRGWALALSMAALAVLWATEIIEGSADGDFKGLNNAVGIWFVIFTIWLSTAMMSLTTVYSRHNLSISFWTWIRAHPVNLITVWGAVGLGILLMWVAETAQSGESWSEDGWILYAVLVYLSVSVGIDILLPMQATRKGILTRLTREGRVGMALLAIAWVGIPAAEFFLDILPEMGMEYDGPNPYSWALVVLFAVLAGYIKRTAFLGIVVSPELETFKREGFRSYDIPRGVYLVYDQKPDGAFGLFSELVSLPLRPDAKIPEKEDSARATLEFLIPSGLVVTREFPDSIRRMHSLETTPVIWLTESPGERRIAPTSTAMLTDTLVRFMEKNPNSIVLLEGIEYLTTFSDFRKVLKQLDYLNETTWVTRARLLIAVNPKAFDPKDLALLERDRTVIEGAAGIDELKRESLVSELL